MVMPSLYFRLQTFPRRRFPTPDAEYLLDDAFQGDIVHYLAHCLDIYNEGYQRRKTPAADTREAPTGD
jgi:hypothetical protein